MFRTAALQVSADPSGVALSPAHKRFNALIRQIEQVRQKLATWNDNMPAYRKAHAEVLQPLQAEMCAGLTRWALALDALLDQPGWTSR